MKRIVEDCKKIEEKIIEHRRILHSIAEVGFNTEKTREYIKKQLAEIGLTSTAVGRGGLKAELGDKTDRTVLLRADIDALPIEEKSGESFAAKNGNMHACAHDMHTAMLLGAAEILLKNKDKIRGRIIFCFQSAEETLEGASDMIEAGLLEDKIDAAIMLHVLCGIDFPSGFLIVSSGGVSAPSSDFFEISVRGESSHGSLSHLGKNALATAARILFSIEDLPSREFAISDDAVLSVGSFNSGTAPNVTADFARLSGTFRAYDETVRERLKSRINEISVGTARLFGCTSEMEITSSCPTLINNSRLSDAVFEGLKETVGTCGVTTTSQLGARGGGSEDFAYISHRIPSVMIALVAGSSRDGYSVPLHNPKTKFDERALAIGTAAYVISAISALDMKDS